MNDKLNFFTRILVFVVILTMVFWLLPGGLIMGAESGTNSSPVINLNGEATVNLVAEDTYIDATTAFDAAGNEITKDIKTSITFGGATVETVDTSLIGTYLITYNVSDAAGNAAVPVLRTVIISEAKAPLDGTPLGETASGVLPLTVSEVYDILFVQLLDYTVLDVRSTDEYNLSHIKGAISIPLADLEGRVSEVNKDNKDKPVIVYCYGVGCDMAKMAAETLINNGFTVVFEMIGGGITEWETKGYPIEGGGTPVVEEPSETTVEMATLLEAAPSNVIPEANLTYTITLKNKNTETSFSNIDVSVDLPDDVTFVSSSIVGLVTDLLDPSNVSYQIGSLVPGADAVETIVVSAPIKEGVITCGLVATYNIGDSTDLSTIEDTVDVTVQKEILGTGTVSVNDVNLTSEEQIAVLNAVVSGGKVESYQWYKGISSEVGAIIEGATSPTYSTYVTGPYTVVVTFEDGSKAEASGNVNIILGVYGGYEESGSLSISGMSKSTNLITNQTITAAGTDGEISLNKEAVNSAEVGCQYKITLSIEGLPPTKLVDVVLVIDRSGSMGDGNTEGTPLHYAKDAAIDFARDIIGKNANNRIAIVSYNDTASTNINLTNVLSDIEHQINIHISSQGYTNIEDGFVHANTAISLGDPNRSRAIILLSDGVSNTGGIDNSTYYSCDTYPTDQTDCTRAATAAGVAAQHDGIKVFTVGLFGAVPSGSLQVAEDTLDWAQNGGFYPTNSSADLGGIYDDLVLQMNTAASSIVVIDTLTDKFDIVPGSLAADRGNAVLTTDGNESNGIKDVITWDNFSVGDEVIKLVYYVTPRPGYSGTLPVNNSAIMTYTDSGNASQTRNFPITATVCVATITPIIDTLTTTNPATINFTGSGSIIGCGGGDPIYSWKFFDKNNVLLGTRGDIASGTYTILSGDPVTLSPIKAELTVSTILGCKATTAKTVSFEEGTITINKTGIPGGEADKPTYVTLTKGTVPVPLTWTYAGSTWSAKVSGLTAGSFTVTEVVPPGYVNPTITVSGITTPFGPTVTSTATFSVAAGQKAIVGIANTEEGTITINKTGIPGGEADKPTYVTLTKGTVPVPLTWTYAGSTWSAKVSGLTAGSFTVTEVVPPGYVNPTITVSGITTPFGPTVTSTATFSVAAGQKAIVGIANTEEGTITINKTGIPGGEADKPTYVTLTKGTVPVPLTWTYAGSTWSAKVSGLTAGSFTVTEVVPPGYVNPTITVSGITTPFGPTVTSTATFSVAAGQKAIVGIANTEEGTITINKTGIPGGEADKPTYVTLTKGTVPVPLTWTYAGSTWSAKVSGLTAGSFTVTEVVPPGYVNPTITVSGITTPFGPTVTSTATFSVAAGQKAIVGIANTEEGTITINKTGIPGGEADKPTYVTLTKGTVPVPLTWTYAGSTWSAKVSGLTAGSFTVTEVVPPGYVNPTITVSGITTPFGPTVTSTATFSVAAGQKAIVGIANTEEGTITINKTGIPGGEADKPTYVTLTKGTVPVPLTWTYAGSTWSAKVSGLTAGSFTVTEVVPPGYVNPTITVSGITTPFGPTVTSTATFSVAAGQKAIVGIANTEEGTITINKTGIPGGEADKPTYVTLTKGTVPVPLTWTYAGSTWSAKVSGLTAGSFTVTEVVPPGYVNPTITVSGITTPFGPTVTSTATFSVAAGQKAIVGIANTEEGTITINKTGIPGGEADKPTYVTLTKGTVPVPLTWTYAGSTWSAKVSGLTAGSFTVTEVVPPGYVNPTITVSGITTPFGPTVTSTATFSVAAGQKAIVGIANTEEGTITINKTGIPGGEADKPTYVTLTKGTVPVPLTWTYAGSTWSAKVSGLTAGSFTVTEVVPPGYVNPTITVSGITTPFGPTVTSTATFSVAAGQKAIVGIANTEEGTITINKTGIPGGEADKPTYVTLTKGTVPVPLTWTYAGSTWSAKVSGLTAGSFTVTEVVPPGYVNPTITVSGITTPFGPTVTSTATFSVAAGQKAIVGIANTEEGTITINKTGIPGGEADKPTYVTLTKGTVPVPLTWTYAGSTWSAKVSGLTAGSFTVTEVVPPGYVNPTITVSGITTPFGPTVTSTATFSVAAGQKAIVGIANTEEGTITINKTGIPGGEADKPTYVTLTKGTVPVPLTWTYAGSTWSAKVSGLTAGSFTVTEVVPPGYVNPTITVSGITTPFGPTVTSTATFSVAAGQKAIVGIANTEEGTITINKTGIPGGEADKPTYVTLTKGTVPVPLTWTYAGSTWSAKVSGLTAGSFTVTEVVPPGYVNPTITVSGITTPFGPTVTSTATFSVAAGQKAIVGIANTEEGTITINKTGIPGGEADKPTYVTLTKGTVPVPLTWTYAGSTWSAKVSGLTAGSFTVTEVVPPGYVNPTITVSGITTPFGPTVTSTATFSVAAGQKAIVGIANTEEGTITINKTGIPGGEADKPTYVTLTKGTVPVPLTWTYAGSTWSAKVSGLTAGSFTVTEVVPPGYVNPTITVSGITTPFGPTVTSTATFSVAAGQKAIVGIANTKKPGTIHVIKTDANDLITKLQGAVFRLFNSDGITRAKDIGGITDVPDATTDINGETDFTNLEWGNFIVKEITTPKGYSGTIEVPVVIGPPDNLVLTLNLSNPRIPAQLRLLKTDSVTGLPVPNATYNVYNSGGTLVEIIKTGPDGWVAVTLQNWGTYSVKEASAPAGYLLDLATYSVTFDANNTSKVLYVKDTPTGGGGGTVTVAGLIEGGLQVLAFTGIDPIIPLSGGSALVAGLALLIASFRRRHLRNWRNANKEK